MTEAYDEGYEAYICGTDRHNNPYLTISDGHDRLSDDYYDWNTGWNMAMQQFKVSGGI